MKKRMVALLLVALVFLPVVFYGCRNALLRRCLVAPRLERLERRFGLAIAYDNLSLEGLNRLCLDGLRVMPVVQDTILSLRSMQVDVAFWPLLAGRIDVEEARVDGLSLRFVKRQGAANYDFLFAPRDTASYVPVEGTPKLDYARRVNRLLDWVFDLLPDRATLTDLAVSERSDSSFVTLHVPEAVIARQRFQADFTFCEDDFCQQMEVSGVVRPEQRHLDLTLSAPGLSVPYIGRRWGAFASFDRLEMALTQRPSSSGQACVEGRLSVNRLQLYQEKVSTDTINLSQGSADFHASFTPNSVEIDSCSTVSFNDFEFHPFLRVAHIPDARGNLQWHVRGEIHKDFFPAQQLFDALPKGLFYNLQGLQCVGELSYNLLFDADFGGLDSLQFDSELSSRGFRITAFGQTPLDRMSEEFAYTAYEHEKPVRTFMIGPSWSHFTPADSINPYLLMCVLQSEDGGFFRHQGFIPEAMRSALAYDLKERRFARGGSTLTMQLVKNVFLNRKKNLLRKVEEALIVWLIERQHLTTKERMWEVYANIAEWGPLVYGIQEAATFYFQKPQSQLTLEECIFLCSIIPKPKHYRSCFDETGHLNDHQEGFFKLLAERFVAKGVLPESVASTIDYRKVAIPVELLRKPTEQPADTISTLSLASLPAR